MAYKDALALAQERAADEKRVAQWREQYRRLMPMRGTDNARLREENALLRRALDMMAKKIAEVEPGSQGERRTGQANTSSRTGHTTLEPLPGSSSDSQS